MKAALRRRFGLVILAAALVTTRQSIAASSVVADFATQLNDRTGTAEARLEAADRLVSIDSQDSRKVLADALVNFDENPRLAAARALADASAPDPALIEPLFVALNTSKRETSEAVARALSRYSDNSDVLIRLIAVATRVPANPISRREILRVLGAFVDKRSAALLVQVSQDPFESPASKSAAADALMEMTAAPAATNPDWSIWWQQHRDQKDVDFRNGLLAVRSGQLDLLRLRESQLSGEVGKILKDQYAAFTGTARADVLVRYLKSPEPSVRAVGTDIATDEVRFGQTVAASVRDQLRLMISDSDAGVRAGVATAMAKINDPTALGQLQKQLTHEPDANVRAAIARALGVINDASAVPQLLELLNDRVPAVVQASASALSEQLAEKIQRENPPLASSAADALQNAFSRFRGEPANEEVRQALLRAMNPLKQEKLLTLLNGLLLQQRGESASIKRLALEAIGGIGSPRSPAVIESQLRDPDPSVRLAAVRALGSNPAAGGSAVQLMQRCDNQIERDPAVQESAWNALVSLLPSRPAVELQQFANQLSDSDHRLEVLRALAKQLLDQNNFAELAGVRENIGAALMQGKRYPEAAEYFKLALEFRLSQNAAPAAIDLLAGERMDALLQDPKTFDEAIKFANEMDKNPSNVGSMGGKIINRANQLIEPDKSPQIDLETARSLIIAARKMSPALTGPLRDQMTEVETRLNQKLGRLGIGPSGGNSRENANTSA